MQFRKMGPKDQDDFRQMYEEFKTHPQQSPAEFLFESKIQGRIFIAEAENQAIGFIWGNYIAYGTSKYAMVEDLYVKPHFRKQRVATSLLQRIMDEFKRLGAEVVFISVEKHNLEAMQLYEKNGFKLCTGHFYFAELK